MTTLTLEVTEEQVQKWTEEAQRLNMTTPQFVAQSVDVRLSEKSENRDSKFDEAMEYVFQKNSELYRRLA